MATFGKELPDQVDVLAHRTDAQLVLLNDVQNLIRERSALEKEYASKLQAITKRATEKLNKHVPSAILGDEPAKAVTEDAVRRSTLENALTYLTASFDRTAQEHASFSEVLSIQIADELKTLERKKEESKKKQGAFYLKLVSDRDQVYADRIKMQQKYYSNCDDVEASRQKQDRSADDKHAERAAKQHAQTRVDMQNSKNSYLIAITVANRTKDIFYEEAVPTAEDQYQTLQTSIITRLTSILTNYSTFNASHLSTLNSTVTSLRSTLSAVDPVKDDLLFVDYNRRSFVKPGDWSFEPCPSFYDTPEMIVEFEPKVLLQNKLARAVAKVKEVEPLLDAKKREAQRLVELAGAYEKDSKLGSVDDVMDDALVAQHAVAHLTASHVTYDAERQAISEVVGDDRGGQTPHTFKSASFSIPVQCGYCKTSIWGLSKQGKTCKACGLSVHNKCELKVPATCGQPLEATSSNESAESSRRSHRPMPSISSLSRTMSQRNSVQAPPTHSFGASQGQHLNSRVSAEIPRDSSSSIVEEEQEQPTGVEASVLFDFTATSSFELGVTAGMNVQIIEEDDGSGWVKVFNGSKSGLVPSSYIQLVSSSLSSKPAPPLSTRPDAAPATGGKLVRGMYAYDAQGDDELSVHVGQTIELTPNGENYADGWYEGVGPGGQKGIFPSNYVEHV